MDDPGVLVIHRDIAGDHTDETCWCQPHVIQEDTLLTPGQVVELVSVNDRRQ